MIAKKSVKKNHDKINITHRLVFSRFFDIRRNLGNVKEKPTRKTCFSREMKRLALRIYLANFSRPHFFDVNGVSIVIS